MSVVAARGDAGRERWVPRLARLAVVIVVVVGTGSVVLVAPRHETAAIFGALAVSAILTVFSVLGILIAGRKHNPVGLIFSALAVAAVIQVTADDYVLRANVTAPGSLPLVVYVEWVDRWIGVAAITPCPCSSSCSRPVASRRPVGGGSSAPGLPPPASGSRGSC